MKTLRKVLVVDDDPVVGKSFDRVLSGRGYAVVTASDGAEALRKIAAEEYDLVFTDIRMPGMDGIAVAEHIRDRQPWLPVVIVSGYATDENEARARAAGVSTVLHKPLSPAMIEDSARDALRERRVHAPDAAVGLPAGAPRVAAEPRVGGADESLCGGSRWASARRRWVSSTCWSCRSPVWSRWRRSRSGSAVALWPGGCPGSRPGSGTWRSSSPHPSSGSPTSSRFRSSDWGCWSGSASGPPFARNDVA